MIFDSYLYKVDLKKETKRIRSFFKTTSYIRSAKRTFELEKFLFVSSFLIRKLIDSNKLSDEFEKTQIEIEYSKVNNLARSRDYLGRYDIDKNYNLEERFKSKLKLTELINIFIHSHILYFDTSRDNRKGKDHSNKLEVLVTSDWQIERLFYIKLSTYLEICEETHNDFVVHMEWGLKKETDEYMQVLVKSNSSSRKSKKL